MNKKQTSFVKPNCYFAFRGNKMENGKIALVNLGTELTQGFTLNTNAHRMAGQLRDMGFEVSCEITLPDEAEAWDAAWEMLLKTGVQTVILGGGLGPTEDDKTREIVARAFRRPLEFREEWVKSIRDFIESRGFNYSEINRIQAFFPQGATVLDNPVGTAPGFRIENGSVTLFAVPGVPHEALTMFNRHIVPFLSAQSRPFFTKELRLCGIFKSDMAEMFSRVELPDGLSWSSLPVRDGIVFRTYTRKSPEDLDTAERLLVEALDDKLCVVSTDGKTLPETVVGLLRKRKETLSTAESCTGGMVASEMVNIPGASDVFKGGACTYWNETKENILHVPPKILETFGAVSRETATAMAEGARKLYRSDWAVSTTGIAGPGGGTAEKPVGLVWMAVASPSETFAFCKKFSGNREQIREKSVFTVLDALRRAVLRSNEQNGTCTKEQ